MTAPADEPDLRQEDSLQLPTCPLRLHPFRGLMLGAARIGDPGTLRVFSKPYRQVQARLTKWTEAGQARHDDVPGIYLHEYSSAHIAIRGLVGALDLTDHGSQVPAVLMHEGINADHSSRLAERMESLGLNPAPILLAYRGPQLVRDLIHQKIASVPELEFTDRSGQHHRIWTFREPHDLEAIATELSTQQVLVADGHHRFAGYLELHAKNPGTAWGRGLAMLVDQDDTPLFLGAIHRLLGGITLIQLENAALAAGATVEWLNREEAVAALQPRHPVATDGTAWLVMAFPDTPGEPSVQFLHSAVIPQLEIAPDSMTYHHSVDDVLASLTPAENIAVLLPAPSFDVVVQQVSDGKLLPEKATSFQPKPSVGVIMRALADE